MTKEKLKTIDGQTLLSLDLPPIEFVVDRLIPQGLHILAGAPKTGKSWLLLLLCLRVANGERFWNRRTKQGSVLYLCLEDSPNRIQERLSELTENAPSNLHFATSAETLTDGMVEQIEDFISEHPDTNLIVIDTLQKVRTALTDANPYASDYKDIGILKSLADKHGITIIAVQHLRKQFDNDPHAMVTGSTGLLGAADGSYVLKREKVGEDTAKLYIRGRDIEEQIFTIRFDSDSKEWLFIESDTPQKDCVKSDTALSFLVTYLQKEKEFRGTASELSEKLSDSVKSNVLSRKLKKYQSELLDIGIEFTKTRSGERRELLLTYNPKTADDDMTVDDGS